MNNNFYCQYTDKLPAPTEPKTWPLWNWYWGQIQTHRSHVRYRFVAPVSGLDL